MIAVGSLFSKFSVSDKIEKFTLPKVSYDTAHAVSNVEMFNRSPRNFREICSETVVIEPPTVPQFSKKRSMLSVIGPSFTMAIPMVLGCGLTVFSTTLNGSGANAFMFTGIITSVGSALMGGLWAYYNIKETKSVKQRTNLKDLTFTVITLLKLPITLRKNTDKILRH